MMNGVLDGKRNMNDREEWIRYTVSQGAQHCRNSFVFIKIIFFFFMCSKMPPLTLSHLLVNT